MEPRKTRLSHRNQIFALCLIGIIAFVGFFAVVILPNMQPNTNPQNQQSQKGQPVYFNGYVLIGDKGTPQVINFDDSVTGNLYSYVGSGKDYNVQLLNGYTYSVTVQYQQSQSPYQVVTCSPIPSTVSANGVSGSSTRQDFSC